MLMYYGGDIVDLLLVAVFCRQWYRAMAPRASTTKRALSVAAEAP